MPCLVLICHYLFFFLFFFFQQLSRERNQGRPLWSMQQLKQVLQEEEEQKPNPVTQRIKIIMVYALIHAPHYGKLSDVTLLSNGIPVIGLCFIVFGSCPGAWA